MERFRLRHKDGVRARPRLKGVQADSLYSTLEKFWRLTREAELDELFNELWGYACRDQGAEADESDLTLLERRNRGHSHALAAAKLARRATDDIRAIRSCLEQFHTDIDWSPPLLEAIFNVDLANPRDVTLPPEILILMSFERRSDWDAVEGALMDLERLPVRPRFAPGTIPNVTLQRAVRACRHYWRDVEGRAWGMNSLKDKAIRDKNDIEELAGPAEVFVADLLEYVGIEFGLQELCAAWTAIERIDKVEEKPPPGNRS